MERMIELGKPFAGWMDLTIGDQSFEVSYLSDLKSELDYLLNLPKYYTGANRIMLEGESMGDLYLTAFREEYGDDKLYIIWEWPYDTHVTTGEKIGCVKLMEFPFEEFKQQYEEQMDALMKSRDYQTHFICEQEDDYYEEPTSVDNLQYDLWRIKEKYPNLIHEGYTIEEFMDLRKCPNCKQYRPSEDLKDTEGCLNGGIGMACSQCWEDGEIKEIW